MVLLIPPNSENHLDPLQYLRETLPFFRRDEKVKMIVHDAKVPQLKLEAFARLRFFNHIKEKFFHIL
jgi:hypothetical protein